MLPKNRENSDAEPCWIPSSIFWNTAIRLGMERRFGLFLRSSPAAAAFGGEPLLGCAEDFCKKTDHQYKKHPSHQYVSIVSLIIENNQLNLKP